MADKKKNNGLGRAYNVQLSQFFTENVEKSNSLYLNWFIKYYDKLRDDVSSEKKEKQDFEVLYNELRKLRTKRYQEDSPKVRISNVSIKIARKPSDTRIMRPVPPDVRKILYGGLTNEGDGRKSYLKARNTLSPNEKYYGPQTGNAKYGWHLSEDKSKLSEKSEFGRKTVIKNSFYRPNGVGPGYFPENPLFSRATFIIHGI